MHSKSSEVFTSHSPLFLNSVDVFEVLARANVPEHSVPFMQAMSKGDPFLIGPYLFISADKLLLAIGYPLEGIYDAIHFQQSLDQAITFTKAKECMAICPTLPENLAPHLKENDYYYILEADTPVSERLISIAQKAAPSLRLEVGREFTLAHKRLWAEFVARIPFTPTVRNLYEKTESTISQNPSILLLNAWDHQNNLAACLVLDLAPNKFLTYILGAHSKIHNVPYASDFLFLEMIHIARRESKEYIHLGLGVNPGIRRFKEKWGGTPRIPYQLASWHIKQPLSAEELLQLLAPPPDKVMSKQQYLQTIYKERPYRMLWKLEKNGRSSWIGGTAHFFNHSFDASFRKLFDQLETVIFEGPLDSVSFDMVAEVGKNPENDTPRLINYMTEKEIINLERVVCGPKGLGARLLGLEYEESPDVRYYLKETRPWLALFTLWSSFLKRKGWNQSVDLDAWHLARAMGKKILGMELITEQIETLESISPERIVDYFRLCPQWEGLAKRHQDAYLAGDLDAMMGTTAEFPSRTKVVINRRDEIFLQRMLPYIEQGDCVVFVGSSHMFNLRGMLADAGFEVQKTSI